MLFLFLVDESRENYRDVICSVMRQLLRKCSLPLFCSHIYNEVVTFVWTCKLTVRWRSLSHLYLSFTDYILEHSEDDTKSLFSIIKVGGWFHKSCCSLKSCHLFVSVEKYPHIRLQGVRDGNGGAFWERATIFFFRTELQPSLLIKKKSSNWGQRC